jgi:F0F1-type ATP synthase assembly protein I
MRYSRGMAVAFEFGGTIAAGALVGWYLDEHFGWTPWG